MQQFETGIKSLYTINLLEGEGVGTAYEYYTKLRKLIRFTNSTGKPKTILIAGLPEKYGLSMDFFLLAHMQKADLVVIDERVDRLEKARNVFSILRSEKILNNAKVSFSEVDHIAQFSAHNLIEGKFDLALSSEVLQRLDGERQTYIANLQSVASNLAIFAPNRGNESHANRSGLKSLSLKELLSHFRRKPSATGIYDYGYMDIPPFPPGLSRSQESRDRAVKSRLEGFLMKGLEIYSLLEYCMPNSLKKSTAHIVYVMLKE